ncbi:pilus assembly PilX family protein [Noviherbaspirillum sp.]|uniref:pilus assembly PilX family protein n=1 Tax=Noviherbaspirillum sp. TaxID=1926288 RepID=UPI002FE3A6CD
MNKSSSHALVGHKATPATSICLPRRYSIRQDGVVLLFALIILVAMTMAGVAMIRSVDTGNVVIANLGFKQGTTWAADTGTETAIDWLRTVGAGTNTDQASQGYYATSQDALDLTGTSKDPNKALVDWDLNGCNGANASACVTPSAPMDAGFGNSVNYIIHRLCKTGGGVNDPGNSCATNLPAAETSPNKDEISPGTPRAQGAPSVYYRITSRAKGPKNSVTFVETVMHFPIEKIPGGSSHAPAGK